MRGKFLEGIFTAIILLIVILFFTIIDYWIHELRDIWSVPDYYFRNKIPFGFLWGMVGLLVATRLRNIWLKALGVAGIIAISLQVRYFIEGYNLTFVFLFLPFHFIIVYFLSLGMFVIIGKYK